MLNLKSILKQGKQAKHTIMCIWLKSSIIECSHLNVNTLMSDIYMSSSPLFIHRIGKKSGRSYPILKIRTTTRSNSIVTDYILTKSNYNWLNIRSIYIKNILNDSRDILNVRHDVHRSVIKVRSK